MGFTFSLVLSREVTDEESSALQEAGCSSAVFDTDTLPTNAEVTVTKMDFDDTVSPSLAAAIESALEAVKTVPDLSVPGLIVPAQPAERPAEGEPAGVVVGEVVAEEGQTEDAPAETPAAEASPAEVAAESEQKSTKPAPKKARTRKPKKAATVETG